MERSLICVAAAQSAAPLCFSNSKQFVVPIGSASDNFTTKRRRPVLVKALAISNIPRNTLSSNWDVTNFASFTSSAPAWLPRFEELDTTNMLLRQRIIFLGSQVDDVTADFIISQLLLLDAEDPTKDIKLFINSPGGSITAGMGIYDAMKLCKADVSTICMGLAASMGGFLLAAGTKGKRFCMPNGKVMIHQPLGTAGGTAIEFAIRIREMCYHKTKVNKIFSRITGKPVEQIDADSSRDYFMDAWEAKEYGLVDAVIDDGKPGLVAPPSDPSPPPRFGASDLWNLELAKEANVPSERKLLQNGHLGG